MTLTTIACVDVFSGIGGISRALRSVLGEAFVTKLYCECDAYCQRVLASRMTDGHIECAPIAADIKTLKLSSLFFGDDVIKMLAGGFPCQDVSCIGLRKGIVGGSGGATRSGLFFEMMRLVDEAQIDVVFLENVSNILHCGLSDVVSELAIKREFDLYWTCKSAASMGAPHVRNRWFGLAVRRSRLSIIKSTLSIQGSGEQWDWSTEPCSRVIERDRAPKGWVHRSHCLGNSVVPCVVAAAFKELAVMMLAGWGDVLGQGPLPGVSAIREFSEFAIIKDGKYINLASIFQRENQGIGHSIAISIPDPVKPTGAEPLRLAHYPTPRRGMVYPSSLTERSIRDLPTILVHSVAGSAHGSHLPNMNYVEWLMGYPADWTLIHDHYHNSESQKTQAENDERVISDSVSAVHTTGHKKRSRESYMNAMHLFMRDNPGKDIKTISDMWKALSDEQRKVYKERLREMRNGN